MQPAKKKQQQELDNSTHPAMRAEEKYESREERIHDNVIKTTVVPVKEENQSSLKAFDKQSLSEVSIFLELNADNIIMAAEAETSPGKRRLVLKDGIADMACRKLAAENFIKQVKTQIKKLEEKITETWNEEEMPLLKIMMEGE